MKDKYLPQNERKKILLISDDLRAHSGVGNISKAIVLNSSHHYNWCQIAGGINHAEKGKIISLSDDANKHSNTDDAYVMLYPSDGYGNAEVLRAVIEKEKPDALMLFTDPRSFIWVFAMENEIRNKIPIIYLNIWDSLPAPQYNREYYESCDLLMAISKQTKNINKLVLDAGDIPWNDLDNQ